MMLELGYWIAQEACEFQARLCNDFKQDIFVTINLIVDLLYYVVDPRLRVDKPGTIRHAN